MTKIEAWWVSNYTMRSQPSVSIHILMPSPVTRSGYLLCLTSSVSSLLSNKIQYFMEFKDISVKIQIQIWLEAVGVRVFERYGQWKCSEPDIDQWILRPDWWLGAADQADKWSVSQSRDISIHRHTEQSHLVSKQTIIHILFSGLEKRERAVVKFIIGLADIFV